MATPNENDDSPVLGGDMNSPMDDLDYRLSKVKMTDNSAKIGEFVGKLHKMLEENSSLPDPIVHWGIDDGSMVIQNIPKFMDSVLPKYFTNQDYSSFVRQLNKYSFKKKKNNGKKKVTEYVHVSFQRNNFKEMNKIIRKAPKVKSSKDLHIMCCNSSEQVKDLKRQVEELNHENNELKKSLEAMKLDIDKYRNELTIVFIALFSKSRRFRLIELSEQSLNEKGLRVLVADDNNVRADFVMTGLRYFGYQPEFVNCGFAAIKKTRSKKYDIVLMDMKLLEFDKIEIVKQIRLVDRHTLIIAINSQNDNELIKKYQSFDFARESHHEKH
ncbi:kinase-regulated stress-responsive transcription factor skn7 [Nowakowskiella sp. JEL0078]|nr:kinase-regulated stress-responsive transcription factor skn7 [Nowakowskiella sp. JEL0078]